MTLLYRDLDWPLVFCLILTLQLFADSVLLSDLDFSRYCHSVLKFPPFWIYNLRGIWCCFAFEFPKNVSNRYFNHALWLADDFIKSGSVSIGWSFFYLKLLEHIQHICQWNFRFALLLHLHLNFERFSYWYKWKIWRNESGQFWCPYTFRP